MEELIDLEKLDDFSCQLTDCTNILDDMADELESEFGIDATELNKISDLIWEYRKKISKIIEKAEVEDVIDECEIYHNKRQEMLDDEAREARQRENV